MFVDTQTAIQYGHITYTTMEINFSGWAEFGRLGEYKNLYEGCTAVFMDGIVLGPPDVALDPNDRIYYTSGNYPTAIIWRYAADPGPNMVINDFNTARGDYINIRGDLQGQGVTFSYPSWGTLIQLNGGGSISIYGVQYPSNGIAWA
jgi:hypothetical protein